jgi:hypothetical protein
VQQVGPIERQQWVQPDWQGFDLDGDAIMENNTHWTRQERDNNQIGLQCNAMMTTMMMMKGADDHNKEDPPEG